MTEDREAKDLLCNVYELRMKYDTASRVGDFEMQVELYEEANTLMGNLPREIMDEGYRIWMDPEGYERTSE